MRWIAVTLAACAVEPTYVELDPNGCPVPAEVGPAPTILADHLGAPWGIAGDGDGVIVSLYEQAAVARLAPDGTPSIVARDPFPSGVATDATSFYYATAPLDQSGGRIVRVDRATLATTVLAIDQPAPGTVLVRDGWVYWADRGTFSGIIDYDAHPNHDAGVFRVPIAGGQTQTLLAAEDWIGDVAIDGDTVYATAGQRIVAVPIAGGEGRTVAVEPAGPYGVGAFAGSVYWTVPLACVVRRAVGDGEAVTIAIDENDPYRVIADDRGVTWTNNGSFGRGFAGSAVVRSAPDGSARRTLSSAAGAFGLTDVPGAVYFTNDTLDGDVGRIAD